MKTILFILSFAICQTILCQFDRQGYVTLSRKYFDSSQNKYVLPALLIESKAIYRNRFAIREMDSIYHEEKNDKTIRYEIYPIKYFFIDLKTKKFYEYSKLEKNIKYSREFLLQDTMKEYPFAYIFFGSKDSASKLTMPNEKYFEIPDTLIEGIKYKRLKCLHQMNYQGKNYETVWIPYFRYDIKKSILHLSKEFDEKMNWPMVKMEVFGIKNRTLLEINYIRSELTKEENEIFDAWERNAKLNSVTNK